MKAKSLLGLTVLLLGWQWSHAQGTAFTYQGLLNNGTAAANGSYDMTFALFDASSGGTQQGGLSAIFAIPVSNGLFTVTFDLGNNFPGADRWLEIAVRTNSGGALTTLTPRQKITPTPYAITAGKAVTATSFGGSLAGDVTGLQGATVVSAVGGKTAAVIAGAVSDVNGATNEVVPGTLVRRDSFSAIKAGAITSLSFNGYGGGITGLNASQLASGTVPDARLSANVPLMNSNQIFTGVNIFSNVTTIVGSQTGGWPNPVASIQNTSPSGTASPALTVQATGNLVDGALAVRTTGTGYIVRFGTATGWMADITTNGRVSANSFQGNGALPWQVVAGTSQQAQPNTGYLATNGALVTLTLPTSPNPGDVVRVSGAGAGGWKIAQNAGQSVLAKNLVGNIGVMWTPRDSSRSWYGVASSADGSKLVAVVNRGQIYTSADSSVTWTPRGIATNWDDVASSADGTKLVAVVNDGQIYTSTDSGVTWTPRDSPRFWHRVASSADGTKIVAVVNFIMAPGQIYSSTDSGVTWTPRDSSRFWGGVASSADGTKLVAVETGGQVYTSTDSGATWTPRESSRSWNGVASSADGTKLVAVAGGGQIYTSIDSGVTWTPRDSSRNWGNVASSANGTKLVAVVYGGQIYTSMDSGVTWMPQDSNRSWSGVTASADGSKLVAGVSNGGQIYTSSPTSVSSTTSGTTGYLQGDADAAIELQFTGNGQFKVISHEGLIGAY